MVNYVILDTETSGLNPYNSFIVQLSWIVYNTETKQKEENNFILDVPCDINNSHIHGITKEMTLGKWKFEEIIGILLDDIKEADKLIFHNGNYDLNMIEIELDRCGMFEEIETIFCKKYYDTMLNSVNVCKLYGKNKNRYKYPKLSELYFHLFGKEFENQHSAIYDCRATLECYNKLQEIC